MALAMLPVSAAASTVITLPSGDGVRISYTADVDESNDLSISRDGGEYLIEDPGAPIAPAGACTRPTPANTHLAHCPADGVVVVGVLLEDENDRLAFADSATPPEPPPPGEFPLQASGGEGNDNLAGGSGPDFLDGGPGNDPSVAGGSGDDSLVGGDGVDGLLGGPGADRPLWGGDGNDNIDGGDGNDEMQGGNGDDGLHGGGGNDQLDFPFFSELHDSGGSDALEGGPGDDNLAVGPAGRPLEADVLSGGEGTDTADFSKRTQRLTIDLDDEADDGEVGEHDNVRPGVECVIGGSEDDKLIGSSAADCLDGGPGEDDIHGLAGNDMLEGGENDPSGDDLSGGSGSDTMRGGSGDDALVGGEGNDDEWGQGGGDTVEGEDGNDQLQGGAGADTVDGGDGQDSVDGGAFLLIGGDGPDELIGGRDDDKLFGRRGNDRLDGGLGADDISGGSERDTVTYEDRTNQVFVTLDDRANDGEADEGDNVRRDVEVVLGGMRGDDLSGDAADNTVEGARGEDYIDGHADEDRLFGGNAPDIVRAHDGEKDDVACGDGVDLAIADGRDKVIECEAVDRPGARQPIVGRSARVRREGKFQLRLPEGRRFFRLNQDVKIPIKSTIDPRAKAVGLVTANRTGARQVASVSAGRFTVRQGRRRPVTKLRLAGRLPDCRGSSPRGGRAKRAARPPARALRVDVGGPVSAPRVSKRAGVSGKRRHKKRRRPVWEVIGENSVGTSDGTEWLTKERCDGTLTKVISGTVRVRDFGLGETIRVRAGKSHLAAAP